MHACMRAPPAEYSVRTDTDAAALSAQATYSVQVVPLLPTLLCRLWALVS